MCKDCILSTLTVRLFHLEKLHVTVQVFIERGHGRHEIRDQQAAPLAGYHLTYCPIPADKHSFLYVCKICTL